MYTAIFKTFTPFFPPLLPEVTLVLTLTARYLSLSSEELKNYPISETSRISLWNDSGYRVDLKFSEHESRLMLSPDQYAAPPCHLKSSPRAPKSCLRFLRNATPPPSSQFITVLEAVLPISAWTLNQNMKKQRRILILWVNNFSWSCQDKLRR
jgi:hypothetical protein